MVNSALAGLVVLIIGDSHLANPDFLLSSLQDALMNQGAIVHSYGVCASQPNDWVKQTELPCGRGERHNADAPIIDKSPKVKTWSLETLIEEHHPNLLIVELGDNMGAYGTQPALPKEWISFEVQEMLKPIGASSALRVDRAALGLGRRHIKQDLRPGRGIVVVSVAKRLSVPLCRFAALLATRPVGHV